MKEMRFNLYSHRCSARGISQSLFWSSGLNMMVWTNTSPLHRRSLPCAALLLQVLLAQKMATTPRLMTTHSTCPDCDKNGGSPTKHSSPLDTKIRSFFSPLSFPSILPNMTPHLLSILLLPLATAMTIPAGFSKPLFSDDFSLLSPGSLPSPQKWSFILPYHQHNPTAVLSFIKETSISFGHPAV